MSQETAYFGGGCFWNTELVFSKANGILGTEVGFCQPTKNGKQKLSKVEVVKIVFDDKLTTFIKLIDVFWVTHNASNPSNQNQKNIERSVLFYINEQQKNHAEVAVEAKNAQEKIYTTITSFDKYSRASDRDQHYYF
ncbi:MAG: peptide-methionine (S)-S-oxide reductase [Candidatus Heimdallarchaeota archaeon]|nr:peptide-methionine (S)-S-oxide reductase [Candidatus Heimdallarchaeota archaeon]